MIGVMGFRARHVDVFCIFLRLLVEEERWGRARRHIQLVICQSLLPGGYCCFCWFAASDFSCDASVG